MLSGDESRVASASQRVVAEWLPHSRLELIAGYEHGINLLQLDRRARASLGFWRAIELG